MAYTSLEIIALIFIVAAVLKIVVILVAPKSYLGFAKKVWSNALVMSVIMLALAGVVLYYLLQTLSIVQIVAAGMFIALLVGVGFAPYASHLLKIYEKKIGNGRFLRENWLYLLVWLGLMGWALYELLGLELF